MALHLTHTGLCAGLSFCGIEIRDRKPNDRFEHMAYNQTQFKTQLAECCKKCRAEYMEAIAEEQGQESSFDTGGSLV